MTTHPGQESKNEETVRRFYGAYEDRTPDLLAHIVSPEYRDLGHEPPGVGPQGARDDYDGFFAAFDDVSYGFDEIVAGEDRVAVLWTATMTHTGTFVVGEPHVLATGRRVTMRGSGFYRLADGLITETRVLVDLGTLRAQLTDSSEA